MNVWMLAWVESFPRKDTTAATTWSKVPELSGGSDNGSPQFASKKNQGVGEEEESVWGKSSVGNEEERACVQGPSAEGPLIVTGVTSR